MAVVLSIVIRCTGRALGDADNAGTCERVAIEDADEAKIGHDPVPFGRGRRHVAGDAPPRDGLPSSDSGYRSEKVVSFGRPLMTAARHGSQ